jgi:hypothetical protein
MDRFHAFRRSLVARLAQLAGDEGCSAAAGPEVAALAPEQREALAAAWARDGALEHASVASFGRFALELLAAGAPAALVAEAHRTALDEVRHARLCFGLASAYAGEAIAPRPFDFGRGVAVDADLAAIAVRALVDGGVGETLAAVRAATRLAAAEDPAVRAALAVIAADEVRHAELAWRTVAWAVKAGGDRVREALRRAMARVSIEVADAPRDEALRAHGRLDGASLRAAMERAMREVVMPCARSLIEEPAMRDAPMEHAEQEARAA